MTTLITNQSCVAPLSDLTVGGTLNRGRILLKDVSYRLERMLIHVFLYIKIINN